MFRLRILAILCIALAALVNPTKGYGQWTPLVTSVAQLAQQSLSNSSFAIDTRGGLYAWGSNDSGQLGLGTLSEQHAPVLVPLPTGGNRWVRVAAGSAHSLAIVDSDKIFAWGANASGELGIGTRSSVSAPVRVANPVGVRSWRIVSAGLDHSLALEADKGILYGWGSNARGQLGTGDHSSYASPHPLTAPPAGNYWTAAAAGAGFTVAVDDKGNLYAWGADSTRTWAAQGESDVPVRIATGCRGYGPLPTVAASYSMWSSIDRHGAVSVGGRHANSWQFSGFATALGGDHTVHLYVFGNAGGCAVTGGNRWGQLGDGSTTDAGGEILKYPTGVHSWVAAAAGLNHSLAIADDGYLYAWGDNRHGQLGASALEGQLTPHRILLVNDTGSLRITLTVPPELPQIPFSVSLAVADTLQHAVSECAAHLVVLPTLWRESQPDQMLSQPIVPGDSARYLWTLGGDSVNGFATAAPIYAYVTAHGASPAFVSASIILRVKRGPRPIVGAVFDSTTAAPLPGAVVFSPQIRDTTLVNGGFRIGATGATTEVTVARENFNSAVRQAVAIPYLPDTLSLKVLLDSADLLGRFMAHSNRHSLGHLYFCDSLVGYAIAHDSVFRTDDAGATWYPVARLLQSLTSLAFADRDEGWVVGKQGMVAHTTDGGSTWRYENLREEGPDLYSVAYANGWVWAVGDNGTILMKPAGQPWTEESSGSEMNLRCLHPFNRYHGVAVGQKGFLYTRDLDHWVRLPVGVATTFTACCMVSENRAYLGDSTGALYSIDPGNLYSTLQSSQSGTTEPIANIFFVNPAVGWAVGDRGNSVVTYDSGHTWAPVFALGSTQTSLDFWSVTGRSTSTDSMFDLEVSAKRKTAIVRGRILEPNGTRGLCGAQVTLHGSDGKDRVTYSNPKGNYVFTGIPSAATPQAIDLYFWDSTGVWKSTQTITAHDGQIETVDFRHPSRNVEIRAEDQIEVETTGGGITVHIADASDACDVTLFDILGRVVFERPISRASSSEALFIPSTELHTGFYVVRCRSDKGMSSYKLRYLK